MPSLRRTLLVAVAVPAALAVSACNDEGPASGTRPPALDGATEGVGEGDDGGVGSGDGATSDPAATPGSAAGQPDIEPLPLETPADGDDGTG